MIYPMVAFPAWPDLVTFCVRPPVDVFDISKLTLDANHLRHVRRAFKLALARRHLPTQRLCLDARSMHLQHQRFDRLGWPS
jgi:hypothetical protein